MLLILSTCHCTVVKFFQFSVELIIFSPIKKLFQIGLFNCIDFLISVYKILVAVYKFLWDDASELLLIQFSLLLDSLSMYARAM